MGTPRVKFNLPEEAYTIGGVSILKAATEEEARKEYQRLRRVAIKRLKRLEGTEYDEFYQKNKDRFRPSGDLETLSQLGSELSNVYRYLNAKGSSLQGKRAIDRKKLKTLHEHGYNISKAELKDFGDFMNAYLDQVNGFTLGSDRVAEVYEAGTAKNIPPDELLKDFDFWRRHKEDLDAVEYKEGMTLEQYKAEVNKIEAERQAAKKARGSRSARKKKGG